MKGISLIILFFAAFLSGCGASVPYKTLLTKQQVEGVGKLKVISVVKQNKIRKQADLSHAGAAALVGLLTAGVAGGIVSGLAANAIVKSKESDENVELLQPYYDMLSDYNYRKKLHVSFSEELEQSGIFDITGTVVDPEFNRFEIGDYVDDLAKEKALVIFTEYLFDFELNLVYLQTKVDLYFKDITPRDSRRKKYLKRSWVFTH